MIVLSMSTLGTFSLVLSVVVAITQQRECYKWEYPCENNDGCCNCLMCPGTSACTRTDDEIEVACWKNIPKKPFYSGCANIAHCGWREQEATFPTCPPIPPQNDYHVRVTYISPPTYFRFEKIENHLFAEARIVCADGTNSTVVECLPGGTDGSGGRWNGSISLVCNKDHGADVVSTPPNQISSKPSMIASDDLPNRNSPRPTPSGTATRNDTLHFEATTSPGMQNNTSGNNITDIVLDKTGTHNVSSAEKSEFPVFAIALIVCVVVLVLLGSAGLIYWFCVRIRGTDNQRDPEDGGPSQDDPLLTKNADVTRKGTKADHHVSRANRHASENGNSVQRSESLQSNGEVATHRNRETPHANNAAHLLCVEATDRGPTESSVDSLEMQTRGDSSTLRGNLDREGGSDHKESMRKKMPSNNIVSCPVSIGNLPSPPQQGRRDPVEDDIESTDSVIHSGHCPVAVVNPLSQAQSHRAPEEQDDRNIPGSESSLSTGGSDSDNQASTTQTNIKELYDSGQDQDQGVGEVNGSDEGLPSIDDLSKADPVDRREDGKSYYTGTGTPEEVNMAVSEEAVDSQANPLDFPVTGAASGPAPGAGSDMSDAVATDVVMEEHEHASGGPSDDNRNEDRAELDRGRVAQRHNQVLAAQGSDVSSTARSDGLSVYHGDPEGEHECNMTFVQASTHDNFQAFVPELAVYTDQPCALWRPFSSHVCGECRPHVLDNKAYMNPKKGDAMGIGGRIFYECATNLGRRKKLYRLIHFFAYYSEVPHRESCLKLVKDYFGQHSATCRPCKAIFEQFNIS